MNRVKAVKCELWSLTNFLINFLIYFLINFLTNFLIYLKTKIIKIWPTSIIATLFFLFFISSPYKSILDHAFDQIMIGKGHHFCQTYSCHKNFVKKAYAQQGGVFEHETLGENPKIRETIVSAGVPDIIPPGIPVLISPANASMLTELAPFSWYGVDDNVATTHYQLWLNGQLAIDSITASASAITADYDVVYDLETNSYVLSYKLPIADGDHTWKITALDARLNKSSSATWSFLLDRQAPYFIINKVDQKNVSVSAGDLTTIPEKAIEIENRTPTLKGVGEAHSQVSLSIVYDNQPQHSYSFSIDASGNWSFDIPDNLPRDKIMFFNFLIIDRVGHTSIIENLKIIIPTKIIIIPAPTLPTWPTRPDQPPKDKPQRLPFWPRPSLPDPNSGIPPTPISPTPSLEPSPQRPPQIEIPIKDVDEIIDDLIDKAPPILQQPLQQLTYTGATVVKRIDRGNRFWQFSPLVGLFLIFGFRFWLMARKLDYFNAKIAKYILMLIGLRPKNNPAGTVFVDVSQAPLPFAVLNFIGYSPQHKLISRSVISDEDGVFWDPELEIGEYRISARASGYIFPSFTPRPYHRDVMDYYQSESFCIFDQATRPVFLIPVTPTDENNYVSSDINNSISCNNTGNKIGDGANANNSNIDNIDNKIGDSNIDNTEANNFNNSNLTTQRLDALWLQLAFDRALGFSWLLCCILLTFVFPSFWNITAMLALGINKLWLKLQESKSFEIQSKFAINLGADKLISASSVVTPSLNASIHTQYLITTIVHHKNKTEAIIFTDIKNAQICEMDDGEICKIDDGEIYKIDDTETYEIDDGEIYKIDDTEIYKIDDGEIYETDNTEINTRSGVQTFKISINISASKTASLEELSIKHYLLEENIAEINA